MKCLRFNFSKIFGFVTLFFCLTPWASWGLNTWDSQPWPFLFCLSYILLNFKSISISYSNLYVIILILVGVSIAGLIDFGSPFLYLRSIVSYLTIPLVVIYFTHFVGRHGRPIKFIVTVNLLWILAGIVEIYYPDQIATISAQRTTAGRGVTSLSPEPTFFAIYLFFSSWLLLSLSSYKPNFSTSLIILAMLLSIILLSKSPMGVVFLLLSLPFFLYIIFGANGLLRFFSVFLVIFTVMYFVANFVVGDFLDGTRLSNLFTTLINAGVVDIFLIDASINVRLEHAVMPIYLSITNYFVPYGFGVYGTVRESFGLEIKNYFWYGSGGHVIMSWVGAIIFELGFFGLFILGIIYYSCKNKSGLRSAEIILLYFILLSAVPLAFSVVPLLLAVFQLQKLRAV